MNLVSIPHFSENNGKLAEQTGDYVRALQLEADAAEMCAAQYEKIPIAYGLKGYQKHRDAYRQHTLRLQHLAQQNPKRLPKKVNAAKQIARSLETQAVPVPQKADVIRHIAKSDARVKTALGDQSGVHAYPSFKDSRGSSVSLITAVEIS